MISDTECNGSSERPCRLLFAGLLCAATLMIVGCAVPTSYHAIIDDGSTSERLALIQFAEDHRGGVPELIRLSRNGSKAVRLAAVRALGRIEDPAGFSALKRALSDSELSVRLDAAFSIGQVGTAPGQSARAQSILLEALGPNGAGPDVRGEIWRALGRVGDATVLNHVSKAEGRERVDAMMAAALIVRRHSLEPDDFGWIRTTMKAGGDELAAGLYIYALSKGFTPPWIAVRAGQALTDPDPSVVEAAIQVLRRGVGRAEATVAPALLNTGLSAHQRATLARAATSTGMNVLRDKVHAALPAIADEVRKDPTSAAIHVLREVLVGLENQGNIRQREQVLKWQEKMAKLPGSKAAIKRRRQWLKCAFIRARGRSYGCTGPERILAMAVEQSQPLQIREVAKTGSTRVKMLALEALQLGLNKRDVLAALASGDRPLMAHAAMLAGWHDMSEVVPAFRAALDAAVAASDWGPAKQILGAWIRLSKATAPLEEAMKSPNLTYARMAASALNREFKSRPLPEYDASIVLAGPASTDRIQVQFELETGNVIIELYADIAPKTVARMANLVSDGFYDGLTMHTVKANNVVQGGDPRGDGTGGMLDSYRCENNRTRYERGTVGIVTAGKDIGGSQFVVALSKQPHIHFDHPAIGKVISGMEAIDALIPGDRILKARLN